MKSGGLLSRGLDGAELRAQHVYHPPLARASFLELDGGVGTLLESIFFFS